MYPVAYLPKIAYYSLYFLENRFKSSDFSFHATVLLTSLNDIYVHEDMRMWSTTCLLKRQGL